MKYLLRVFAVMIVVVYTSSKKWCHKPSINDKIASYLKLYLSGLKHSCKAQRIVDKSLEAGVYRNASAHEVCFIKGSYTFESAAKIFVDTVVGDIIRTKFKSRYACTVHHGCVFEGRLYENMDRFLCLFLDKRKRRKRKFATSLNKEAKCHRPSMSKYVKYYLKSYLTKGEHTLLKHSCAAQTISDMDLKAGVYYRLAIFKMCWHGKYWDMDIAKHFVDTHGNEISQTRFTRKFACQVHDGCLYNGVYYNYTEKQIKHLTCTFLEKPDRHRPLKRML